MAGQSAKPEKVRMRADTLESIFIFRATPDLRAEVREAAEREHLTVSEFARRALATAAGNRPPATAVAR